MSDGFFGELVLQERLEDSYRRASRPGKKRGSVQFLERLHAFLFNPYYEPYQGFLSVYNDHTASTVTVGYSPTVTAKARLMARDREGKVRFVSAEGVEFLMGLPKGYLDGVGLSDKMRREIAGDGVPVPMARALGELANRMLDAERPVARLINADARSVDLDDDSVDLIMTDPFYHKVHLPMWKLLGDLAMRVLRPGGFLVTYSGTTWKYEAGSLLEKAGLQRIWEYVALHGGRRTPVHHPRIFSGYKAILVYAKPKYVARPGYLIDVIGGKESKGHFRYEQDVSEAEHFINHYSDPGDLVFDPFAGSATTGVASIRTGRRWVGTEIDSGTYNIGQRRLTSAMSRQH